MEKKTKEAPMRNLMFTIWMLAYFTFDALEMALYSVAGYEVSSSIYSWLACYVVYFVVGFLLYERKKK